MIESDLKTLGLSKNEASIYLTLVEFGKTRAGSIIKNTGLHRNIVYSGLESLVSRHLVTKTVVGGVAEFICNDPEKLVDEVLAKKELAIRTAEKLRKLQAEKPREITVFEGADGIKQSREEIFKHPNETLFVIGASKSSSSPELEKTWREVHRKREKAGIDYKILYEQSADPSGVAWRNQMTHSEARYLPFKAHSPVWFAGIGDYLEIGIPSEEPLIFGIKSKEAVDGLRDYFNHFWKQDVMIFEGNSGFELAFSDILETLKPEEELQIMGIFEFDDEFSEMITSFHKKRSNAGIKAKILLNAGAKKIGSALEKMPNTVIRYLQDGVVTPAVFLTYANKTLISLPNQRTFLQIKNRDAAESFKSYFNVIWNKDMFRG